MRKSKKLYFSKYKKQLERGILDGIEIDYKLYRIS